MELPGTCLRSCTKVTSGMSPEKTAEMISHCHQHLLAPHLPCVSATGFIYSKHLMEPASSQGLLLFPPKPASFPRDHARSSSLAQALCSDL